MAILIQPDGQTQEVEPKNGSNFELDELQAFIGGGNIEIVDALNRNGCILVIDEDGKGKKLPWNAIATDCLGVPGDIIAGPALLCLDDEVN